MAFKYESKFYIEMVKSKEVIENQQKKLHNKTLTIDYLTEQVRQKNNRQTTCNDLLDIN